MTIIKDIFEKDIERSYNPVIMVSDQNNERVMFQELDEYVVTSEIDRNLEKTYRGIEKGLSVDPDKKETNAGIWISGDFGSGKSHFMKILSYILENRSVNGLKAYDIIAKKVQPQTRAIMQALSKKRFKTILFDIDAEAREGDESEIMVHTYFQVFYRSLGLSTNLAVAQMEYRLMNDGKYTQFVSKYSELHGKEWSKDRDSPIFIKNKIQTALEATGIPADEAEQAAKSISAPVKVNVDDFIKVVNGYVEAQGKDFILVFLVDEVGQFISSQKQRILKLQTITEHMCIHGQGRILNIVSSQEDVESLIQDFHDQDFSKIQGRFATRVKMSASDVAEVIEKRILAKKESVIPELKAYYVENKVHIENKLIFKTDMTIGLFKNADDFVTSYPFVPYQYLMLQKMFTELRNKTRAGKNISNAARSMLKSFKDAAIAYKDRDLNTVMPLYGFFGALWDELDSTTRQVFDRAEKIFGKTSFELDVLKTLYLVKYYERFDSNIPNITSLMVDDLSVNHPRLELQNKIKDVLEKLIKENFVQAYGEVYSFLTNEEQEINLAIRREAVDPGKRVTELANMAFGEVFDIKSSKYTYKGRPYPFNIIVNGETIGNTNYELTVRINTPEQRQDDASARMSSIAGVVFNLPADSNISQLCNQWLSTQSYIRKNQTTTQSPAKKKALHDKEDDERKLRDLTKAALDLALKNADVYVYGSPKEIPFASPDTRLKDAMDSLIVSNYPSLNYFKAPVDKNAIKTLITTGSIGTFDENTGEYHNAFTEMLSLMQKQTKKGEAIRISGIISTFKAKPYGWGEDDIRWMIGMLFKFGKITLEKDSVSYEYKETPRSKIEELLTKARDSDRVLIQLRESVSVESIYNATSVCGELFSRIMSNQENLLVSEINDEATQKVSEIARYQDIARENNLYPYKDILSEVRDAFNHLATQGSPGVFKYIDSNIERLRECKEKYASMTF